MWFLGLQFYSVFLLSASRNIYILNIWSNGSLSSKTWNFVSQSFVIISKPDQLYSDYVVGWLVKWEGWVYGLTVFLIINANFVNNRPLVCGFGLILRLNICNYQDVNCAIGIDELRIVEKCELPRCCYIVAAFVGKGIKLVCQFHFH